MNSTTLYLAQFVFAGIMIILWFIGRPRKCATCGMRLAVKKGFCQGCGKVTDGYRIPTQNQTTNQQRTSKSAGRLPLIYISAVLVLVPSIGFMPLDSGIKFSLGLTVVVGGLIWVLLAIKRGAACRSCGKVTHGSYCSHCGSGTHS